VDTGCELVGAGAGATAAGVEEGAKTTEEIEAATDALIDEKTEAIEAAATDEEAATGTTLLAGASTAGEEVRARMAVDDKPTTANEKEVITGVGVGTMSVVRTKLSLR